MAADPQELTRRDRNKLKHRKEILQAAAAVFAEKGYQQASIQEIADRADFAVSTIYGLFENKEDVYRRVSVDVGVRCGEIFERAMGEGKDEYEKLVNFARAKGEAYRESPEGTRMLQHELFSVGLDDAVLPKNGIGQIYTRFLGRIEELFKSGIGKGLFVKQDPVLLAAALDSATNELLKLSRTKPRQYRYEDRVGDVIQIFFEPVLAKRREQG